MAKGRQIKNRLGLKLVNFKVRVVLFKVPVVSAFLKNGCKGGKFKSRLGLKIVNV
jgi:hypothetical protein